MVDKEVIRTSQHQFTKGKSDLMNLMAFHNCLSLSCEELGVDVVILALGRLYAVSPLSYSN